ncbi:MAG: phage major capsid protein [Clostridia bacterium]|nr:phage major capsid protein [Clostridia bacterium]
MAQITRSNVEALFEPDVVEEIIQGAVKQSAALSMFRQLPRMSSNKMKMRVLDALPMAYWVGAENNGRKKLTKMAWDNKYIVAEELAVIVPIKEDLLDDADIDVWAEVRPRIEEAMARKVDEAIFTGVDKPAGFRADILTSIINAGAEVEQGSKSLYEAVNDAMSRVEESDYNPNGIIGGVGLKGKFRMMLDQSGQPIKGTEIDSINKAYIANGAWDKDKALAIVGDFSQAVYAIRQDITYKVLTEAVIQDPSSGEILYNLAQDDMVALRVVFRMGWEIPNPINALQPDEAVRFPFASIKGSTGTTTKTVTFTVNDGVDAIEGAKVTFGGIGKKTNASGVATFDAQAGDYTYTVKADGMTTASGTVAVAGSAVNKTIAMSAK